MRDLLYLTHRIPYPPNKGDKIRSYHVLRYLQRHFRVHLGTLIDDPDDVRHAEHLAEGCAGSCFVRLHPRWSRLKSLRGLATGEALSLPYFRHAGLQRWVQQTLASRPIDAALAFSGPMGQYLPQQSLRGPLLRIMDLVDVDSEKWRGYAAGAPWPLAAVYRREASLLLAHEKSIARCFDRTMLVSAAEATLFRSLAPESAANIDHFNIGVDSDYFSPHHRLANPYPCGQVVVFTGAMDYPPNIQAAVWFAEQVMPSLRSDFPALQFHIVGARPHARVLKLKSLPGVLVSGTVPDIRPYLRHATLAVAPLRIARGVQSKVLEAMAMEKIVIASPPALEGLSAVPGMEVICAADAAAFIHHVGRQLAAPADIGPAARRRILQDYHWDRNLERLGALLGIDSRPARAPAAHSGTAP